MLLKRFSSCKKQAQFCFSDMKITFADKQKHRIFKNPYTHTHTHTHMYSSNHWKIFLFIFQPITGWRNQDIHFFKFSFEGSKGTD